MSAPTSLSELLNTPVGDALPSGQKLIAVSSDWRLPKAFRTLVQNNIYSAPVWDDEEQNYIGFIDMVDIVTFIVEIFKGTETLGGDFDLFNADDKEARFTGKHVAELARRNVIQSVLASAPLADALRIFRETGVHRVAVLPSPGAKMDNILTKSAVVSFLEKHRESLGPIAHVKVGDVPMAAKATLSVGADQPALDAFQAMAQHRVGAVAVVSQEDQTLLSVISVKDVRALQKSSQLFRKLRQHSIQFAAETHTSRGFKTSVPLIHCSMDHTIEEVIKRLAAFKIHRLFIVDSHRKALGVISLGDLLTLILESK